MPSVTWDTAFEAAPSDLDEAKYGATKIRQLKLAISERGELETNWKVGTQPFIKAGKAAVLFLGTTTEINALTGMSAGASAWDTSLKVFKRYSGAAWALLDLDHGQFSGLADDDHPQYLGLTKAGQNIAENLTMNTGKTIDGMDPSDHTAGEAKAKHTAGLGTHTHLSAGAEGGVVSYMKMLHGIYTGDGLDNKEINIGINLAGMSYVYVMVKKSGAYGANFKIKSHPADTSSDFGATGDSITKIKNFTANGFTVGTSGDVNTSGATYYYVVNWQV